MPSVTRLRPSKYYTVICCDRQRCGQSFLGCISGISGPPPGHTMTLALRRDTTTPALLDRATELFDHALARITEGRVHEGMDRLVVGLQPLRAASQPDEWRPFAEKTCLEHP